MGEIDYWRTADILLKQYGDEALLIAATRADALLDLGDVDGFHAWKRIAAAISDLELKAPKAGEPVN